MTKKLVERFLKDHNMYYEDINLMEASKKFIKEMKKGLSGENSSLKMIPTYINPYKKINYEEISNKINNKIIALDAGGTNFRVALVTYNIKEREFNIDYYKKYPMPGTKEEIIKDEFYDKIVQYILPVLDKSDIISFCFSYPTEILPDKDGRLIKFNKEVKVKDMEGQKIGEGLLNTIKKKGFSSEKKIILLNDTVATLLAGKAEAERQNMNFDSYIGFILGTGTNTCYIEKNKEIVKKNFKNQKDDYNIVNLESGGYSCLPRSDIDESFDLCTEDPGAQHFEKMISGAYQGELVRKIIEQAANEHLFSNDLRFTVSNEFKQLTSKDLDDFCCNPYGDNTLANCIVNEKDRIILYYIIDAFFERAARLVTINLASIMLKIDKGKNPCQPICISAEGTTFYKSRLLRKKINYYIKSFVENELGIYCDFLRTENTTIIGTALAGLLEK